MFAGEFIAIGGAKTRGQQGRGERLEDVWRKLDRANLLFLDPDNGLEAVGCHPSAVRQEHLISSYANSRGQDGA